MSSIPQDAHPKGEIFLGNMMDGYSVRIGVPPGAKDQGFSFTLRTPERWYNFSANTAPDRDEWISRIEAVVERPLTMQDKYSKCQESAGRRDREIPGKN